MFLVIDNFDSFTYNLVQYLGMCGVEIEVVRNDAIDLERVASLRPEALMLSPGPCTPNQSGVCLTILEEALRPGSRLAGIPIFGVCLGHQAIGQVAGGVVRQARNIRHGKVSLVEHDGRGVFAGMPNPFEAVRYHSLVVVKDAVPPGFHVSATSLDDGEIMGMRHETLAIEGVQFHPESVLTQDGMRIVENFVRMATGRVSTASR